MTTTAKETGPHFCTRCLHHWRGIKRVHNCGKRSAGGYCRLAAQHRNCTGKRETRVSPGAEVPA